MLLNTAHRNMIQQQIRACDVLDERILDLIEDTPREEFVPNSYHSLAYADTHLPIGHHQVMMSPREEGIALQSLTLKPSDNVLEIGTGTGYFTTLLAKSAQSVTTYDIFPEFIQKAQAQLKFLKNVSFITGDFLLNLPSQKYDIIFLSSTLPFLPKSIKNILNLGGKIFALIGKNHFAKAVLLEQNLLGQWSETDLFETGLPPFISKKLSKEFIF